MDSFIEKILQKGRNASERVVSEFGQLSSGQLNWKPSEDKWSIGQCLDHLVVSDKQYFPTLDKIVSGSFKMNWWERNSPFTGFFGNAMVQQLGETPKRKIKTSKVFNPSRSNIDIEIINRFNIHLDQFLGYVSACNKINLEKTIITSPAIKFITYNLKDAITFLIQHLHRHINQAVRVKQTDGFPGN